MPFVSKAQQRFMFARHPKIAREFAEKTRNFKDLPEHAARLKAVQEYRKRNKRSK